MIRNDTIQNDMTHDRTIHDDDRHAPDAARFDAAMRRLHAQSLDAASARTQAQLHQRRRAAALATRDTARPRAPWPLLGAGAVAALALAIGWQLRGDHPEPVATPAGDAALAAVDFDAIEALAMLDAPDNALALDENPDLYLWLASDDAAAFTTE